MIKLSSVSKKYKKVQAINKLSLTINPKLVTGIIGPNGSGKSTLINLLTGLVAMDEGAIKTDDFDITNISLSSEAIDLPNSYKVAQALKLFSISKQASEEQVQELIDKLDIRDQLDKNIKALSQGNKQRLNIAIALMGNSKLIILDEPNNGLDPAGFVLLRTLIIELKSAGIGVLIASHLLNEIESVCDEIIFLKNGMLQLHEERESIMRAYKSLELAYLEIMK
jgi:ABC-type multidrug transport system ATPase subunit